MLGTATRNFVAVAKGCGLAALYELRAVRGIVRELEEVLIGERLKRRIEEVGSSQESWGVRCECSRRASYHYPDCPMRTAGPDLPW